MTLPHPISATEQDLLSWLHGRARAAPDLTQMCADLFAVLLEAGVPVVRLNLGVFLLHPELAGVAHQITRDHPHVVAVEVTHDSMHSPTYLHSPIKASVDDRQSRRFRLSAGVEQPYPVLNELQASGFTDYLLVPMLGTLERVHVLSIATDAEGGFDRNVIQAVQAFCAPFGLLVDSLTTLELSKVLLRLYVGNKTGPRVLQGEIRLGRGESIHAAVLYSDMRGFSQMCSNRGSEATINVLNRYFDVVSRSVHNEGGEVLKLMGDAILAVFPVAENGPQFERTAALACLRAAQQAWIELRSERDDPHPLRAGFGLTLGEVIYGNIGAPGRLDFTIIGDAVNLAARLEQMSKELGEDILIGPHLAARAGATQSPLGAHRIKGSRSPIQVYNGSVN